MRRLWLSLALLLSAVGLSGCAVDGSILGHPGATSAATLLADSRSAFGSEGSLRVTLRERLRDGERATTVTSLQFRGVDVVSRRSDGIDADLRVLDGAAWSRGSPLYWVSSQGLESSQVPLVTRGWDAMRPADLHLPRWFIHALTDPSLLERCEVVSLPGGTLSTAGHETFDGHPSVVLLDRRGAETERIVIDSDPPDVPEQISVSGGLPATPGCGISAAAGRAVRSATVSFTDVGSVHIPRPRATLSQARYESLVDAPQASGLSVPANLAHLIAGRYRMDGRVAASLGMRGVHVGERVTVPWTLTPRCTGTRCRLSLTVGSSAPVPVRAGRFGLFAQPRFPSRCSTPGGRVVSRVIPTEIGLTVHAGRLRAWSSEATTACGGPSADYVVWQPAG